MVYALFGIEQCLVPRAFLVGHMRDDVSDFVGVPAAPMRYVSQESHRLFIGSVGNLFELIEIQFPECMLSLLFSIFPPRLIFQLLVLRFSRVYTGILNPFTPSKSFSHRSRRTAAILNL